MSELNDLDLDNIEVAAARNPEAFTHPADVLKLVAEVRRLRAAPLADIPQAELYAELERREAVDPHAIECICGVGISQEADYFRGFCGGCEKLHDEFAKAALGGIISNPNWIPLGQDVDMAAALAYDYAAAMLRRRRRVVLEERRKK